MKPKLVKTRAIVLPSTSVITGDYRRNRPVIHPDPRPTPNRNYPANPVPQQSSKPQGDSTRQLLHLADDAKSVYKNRADPTTTNREEY